MDMWISNIIGAMRLWLPLCAIICFVFIFVIREISSQILSWFVSNHICHFMGKWNMLKLSGTYSDIAHSVYMSNTTGVLWEAGTTYPSRAPEFTLGLWWCPGWSSFSLFVLSYYEYLRSEFRVVRNDIFIINDMRSSLLQVVCRRTRVFLTLFVFACILCFCFAFLRFMCTMLLIYLNCPFLIAPSVFSNVYLQ
jgi:hypothetical protein